MAMYEATTAATPTPLDDIVMAMDSSTSVANRICELADRLLGTTPTPVDPSGKVPAASGVVNAVREHAGVVYQRCQSAHEALGRLERAFNL